MKEPNVTLRQWFAAQALSKMQVTIAVPFWQKTSRAEMDQRIAERCFKVADAMIAAEKST